MSEQMHLNGKGMSKRAVRYKELDPDQVGDNLVATAKLVGENATVLEFKKVEWRNGIKQMITEFSDPCDDQFAPDVKWRKVTPGMLDNIGDYFKSKDVAVLEHVFRELHEATPAEVAAIAGKAVPVSEG